MCVVAKSRNVSLADACTASRTTVRRRASMAGWPMYVTSLQYDTVVNLGVFTNLMLGELWYTRVRT